MVGDFSLKLDSVPNHLKPLYMNNKTTNNMEKFETLGYLYAEDGSIKESIEIPYGLSENEVAPIIDCGIYSGNE